jgi:two-component system chemotaxis response regulator CheB
MDIEMPRMDGISFVRQLMATAKPLPVIIISSLAQKGCRTAVEALEAGAVEVLGKPNGPYSVGDLRFELAHKVRSAASARLRRPSERTRFAPAIEKPKRPVIRNSGGPTIAIGASTGGTEALTQVLRSMPADSPPIVIVQHIPPVFSAAFAERLDRSCSIHVKEAADGDLVLPGQALVAPGDRHMILRKSARGLSVHVADGPRVCYQRPSVDVLFQSVAQTCGAACIGVILTGMGNDGAAGLLKMRQSGARTFGQDEHTCVVFGMPKEAFRLGAVEQVLPLNRIADAITTSAHSHRPM